MRFETALTLILASGALGLAFQALRLGRRWRGGRPQAVDWVAGLRGLPRAYLLTVHDVVARDRSAARMHMMIAGGSVAAAIGLAILALTGWSWAKPVIAAAALAALAGAALALRRRFPVRLPRLSGGAFDRFAFTLGVFAAAALLLAASGWLPPLVWAAMSLMAIATAFLVQAAAAGPLRHALAGTAWLVAHARPKRLAGLSDTALLPLDLDAPALGVSRTADLPWNRLASFDACVQCGRCETACPAYAAGQPLNPKALVHDIVRAMPPSLGETYAGHGHPGLPHPQATGTGLLLGPGGTVRPETLWSCTTCRACVHECPMLIEHVDAVVDMRRHLALEAGDVPSKVAATLHTLRATDSLAGRDPATRLDWAVDLALPQATPGSPTDVLLWLGDGAFQLRNQRTLRALVALMRRAGIDFAVLGGAELDCGDTARRLGDEATFQDLAHRNIATLSGLRFARIVSPDPHAVHALGREYRALGGSFTVLHHSVLLAELFESGRLTARTDRDRPAVTYHDPCYLGRYLGEVDAPRRLLARLGQPLTEMERSGLRSSCCGGGGGAPLSDVPGERRIPDIRMDHARATGAAVVAVACPTCAIMLEGVTGPRPEVADLAELALACVEDAP